MGVRTSRSPLGEQRAIEPEPAEDVVDGVHGEPPSGRRRGRTT